MTEGELRQDPAFWGHLPIYNDDDDISEQLRNPDDPRYTGVIEAENPERFRNLLQDSSYELKGAIRYQDDDVRAVFWKKARG